VDAVGVHVGDALVRIKPAGLPVLILHRVVDDALPRPDRTDPADAALTVTDHVLLDDEPLLAILAFDDPRRPVAKLRIDVFVPQTQRFEDVPVGVDDIVSATHFQLLSSRYRTWKPNERLVFETLCFRPRSVKLNQRSPRRRCRYLRAHNQ